MCGMCKVSKHLRCQRLTKADANYIKYLGIDWTCEQCTREIFPIDLCQSVRQKNSNTSTLKCKEKCASCSGYSYNPKNIRTCLWCENKVHAKCWNDELGCQSCCEAIIPGYNVHSHELYGNYNARNNFIFNPYKNSHFTMLIGDIIDSEVEASEVWSEIAEFLVKCKYKRPTCNFTTSDIELDIYSKNIRSLAKNITRYREDIELYQKYDVICFNETSCIVDKLPNGINDILLEGFHEPYVQAPIRTSGLGGGLAIYVNKRVCEQENIEIFDPNPDPSNTSGEFQFIKLKLCKGQQKTVIIGNIYRSPSRNPDSFNTLFDSVLQKIDRHSKKLVYLVGDFNQDLIQYEHDINCQNLVDYTTNHGFVQIVSRPTRITDHSATLIDHVYTNNLDSTISCNILTCDISDHLAIHTRISLGSSSINSMRNIRNSRTNDTEQTQTRVFNEANNAKFKQLIEDETWDEIQDDMDAQTQYDKFSEIYMEHYNTAYPLKSQRVRRKNERQDPKPWILPWLEDACARKNLLFHDFVKTPTPENKAKYDKLDQFCTKHVEKAKAKYNKDYFEKHKDNSRKQWQLINNLMNRSKKKVGIKKLIDNNGNIINTPNAIAESFNDYFANVASNLKENINNRTEQGPVNAYQEYLKEPVPNSMYVREVEPGEVYSIIKNFKNKATLDSKISALKIANTSFNFTHTLAKIINSSFSEGVFPTQHKTARVAPVHKGGTKTDVTNYRPISLLTSFSKIYEKLMHNRIMDFLESNNSLFDMQYGFRPGRSCEHALLKAQSILLNSLSKRQISLLLLIDFSKAFDMVEHSILLKKLEHYGIRGTALNWMISYLENRLQFVTIDGKDSTTKHMKFGVPQGSILGPLLFIIYINDIPNISTIAKFILYADDANIIITGDSIEEVNFHLQQLTGELTKWVDRNGLALNLKKTQYLIFSRQQTDLSCPLIISNTHIQRKSEARFLGVIVDDKLTWTRHIKTLQSKMSRYVGVMYKIKRYLPLEARLNIYHSFVQSHINYCSLVWGFTAKSNIDTLFSKQKKGIRAVVPGFINYRYRDGTLPDHTKPFFNKYNILTVQGVIVLNALLFIHKVKHFPRSLPMSLTNTIPHNIPIFGSTHETCEEWLSEYNNHIYRSSIFFKGPLLSIIPNIADLTTTVSLLKIKCYKNNVKTALLKIQAYGDENDWQANNSVLNNIPGLRKSPRDNLLNR